LTIFLAFMCRQLIVLSPQFKILVSIKILGSKYFGRKQFGRQTFYRHNVWSTQLWPRHLVHLLDKSRFIVWVDQMCFGQIVFEQKTEYQIFIEGSPASSKLGEQNSFIKDTKIHSCLSWPEEGAATFSRMTLKRITLSGIKLIRMTLDAMILCKMTLSWIFHIRMTLKSTKHNII
jgi:hypothetical protein